MVALVTPFSTDGEVDYQALKALVEWHLSEKTDAIVALGTTAEAATLSADERHRVLSTIFDSVGHKVPVIVGTGSNSLTTTITQTEQALRLGAAAALVVTPYYNRPPQQGLYEHYKTLAKSVPLPLILYNVPARTGVDLHPQTVAQLSSLPNIIGLKEATGNESRMDELFALLDNQFDFYSGDDETALTFMKKGAKGTISVLANIMPGAVQHLCLNALNGHWTEAEKINERLKPLYRALFVESNPIPCKWALAQMKRTTDTVRLPLVSLNEQYHDMVNDALLQASCV